MRFCVSLMSFYVFKRNGAVYLARFHARVVGADLLQAGVDHSKHEILQLTDNLVVATRLQFLDL